MTRRKRFADIRAHCVAMMVRTTRRGGRRIERLLPRFASRTTNPVPL